MNSGKPDRLGGGESQATPACTPRKESDVVRAFHKREKGMGIQREEGGSPELAVLVGSLTYLSLIYWEQKEYLCQSGL